MLRLVKKKYFSKEISIDRFLNFSIKTLILIFIEEALRMGIQIALTYAIYREYSISALATEMYYH